MKLTTNFLAVLFMLSFNVVAQGQPAQLQPLVRVVDLNLDETVVVELCDGSEAEIKVLDLNETRDDVCFAVRRAEVVVEVNGERATLVSATYNLPKTVGDVQIDCSITRGYNSNGRASSWGLEKDVRLRLWPAGSPLIKPGTFAYPVNQKWFATDTQMANVPHLPQIHQQALLAGNNDLITSSK